MREGIWTTILTPTAAAAGALLVAPSAVGGADPGGATAVLGLSLLGVACGGGLLMGRFNRRVRDRLRTALDESAAAAGKERRLRPIRWEEDFASPLVASLNSCLAAAGGMADEAAADSQRRQIEVKLVEGQRRHLEGVLADLDDGVIVTDAFDEIVTINPAAARLCGGQAGLGDALAEVVPEPRLATMAREVRIGGRASRRTADFVIDARAAEEGPPAGPRTYRVSIAPLGSAREEGAASGVVIVLRDTTREAELAQQKNDFVSSVTHELRTPLASIRAYAEMLVDDPDAEAAERQEFCEIIQGEAERLGSMIDSILNISRIESGLVKIDRRPMSPVVVAEKALGVIEPQAKLKNIEVRRELLPSLFQVVADADLLYQVALNLLSNAVKYTPEGGCVTLKFEADEAAGTVITKVIDNGAGIPPDDLPHVFEKFYRVEKNSKMAKGTGLGLPLVKRVIEQDFAGRVWAESVEGEGSTFAFELPMAGSAAGRGSGESDAAAVPIQQGRAAA